MTKNDAYKLARQYRRWAWHANRGPWASGSLAEVARFMLANGYTEQDCTLVRDWLKAWRAGRLS
jgi:hypothetical protein